MKKYLFLVSAIMLICFTAFSLKAEKPVKANYISKMTQDNVINQLTRLHGEAQIFRIQKGVGQVAGLWRESDGDAASFEKFCLQSFVSNDADLQKLFETLERSFEIIRGHYHKIDAQLKMPLHLEGPDLSEMDMILGGYDVSAHFNDDMYSTKVAFITALNFPFYSLQEKTELGTQWTRQNWAYARMGDQFTSRVPAGITQHISKTLTEADAYISDYNIYMGNLINDRHDKLFPEHMKLITHWGLRDELKSNYGDKINGLEKQRMVYQVMKRIVDQTIPSDVINNGGVMWNPYSNKVFKNNQEIIVRPEPNTRYEVFLRNFKAMSQLDDFSPDYPTQLKRAFDATMEIPQSDVETLFKNLLSSNQVKDVAKFIEQRLGRQLEPFDIWYNGFKSRNNYTEAQLDSITSLKYPNADAFKNDLNNILVKLGWHPERAAEISKLIKVESSRGAGHAMGSAMRNDVARLRTRIGEHGMDYKGYNIAIHELGHNVEQTITMNDVDYYMLTGVPNTSFTEATAFLFQKRDLQLLGLSSVGPDDNYFTALDVFWSCYEIMGVSLVDIGVWEWLYQNPNTTASQLKEAVIKISKEVWNTYYAGILGGKDETLLGIYSHMIDYPLYLPNYPMGHIIDFQIEQQIKNKNIATEIERMYTHGRIVPQLWMKEAVGHSISIEPLLEAADEALIMLNRRN